MRTLVVGGGGREHALAWALSRDEEIEEVFAAPGNPGIAEVAKCIEISATSVSQLAEFAQKQKIDLTVVGPEQPLSLGIVDRFHEAGLRIFGPDQNAARVETSKSFARELCTKSKIPVPRWESFTNQEAAVSSLERYGPPWVVKADGLAAGKGTIVTRERTEAVDAIKREIKRPPGRVLLEQYIDGWEATFMATISSDRVQWLTPVFQDYKPVYEQDTGPNTGGMGAYTPVPGVTAEVLERVRTRILQPMLDGMKREGIHYRGVLNLNAMVEHKTGNPYVLEFNARFGDPEAQGVLSIVQSGLAEHLSMIADNKPSVPVPRSDSSACVLIVIASKGYPTTQSYGDKVTLRPITRRNVRIFQAGTARNQKGELVTAGGRVLNVVATGPDLEYARRDAYSTIQEAVHFEGMHYRSDIGILTPRRSGRPIEQPMTRHN